KRQEIVSVLAADSGPAEMIRDPSGPDSFSELLQPAQIFEVQRVLGADRQRDAVHDDRIAFADAIEHVERPPTGDHEIFRNDLEPVDSRPILEHVAVVLPPQPDPATEPREVGDVVAFSGFSHDHATLRSASSSEKPLKATTSPFSFS